MNEPIGKVLKIDAQDDLKVTGTSSRTSRITPSSAKPIT